MSFANVGKVWSPRSFNEYLGSNGGTRPKWIQGVTMHHCAEPSLAQRPRGLTIQHIENIADFYQRGRGWNRGPHLFVDDDQIFGMTPLSEPGIHAVSFNRTHLGIEVLGDYDSEDPLEGRGYQCWHTAALTVSAIFRWLEAPVAAWPSLVTFHRDDPKTNKTCPGLKVHKDWFLQLVESACIVDRDVLAPDGGRPCSPVLSYLVEREVPQDYVTSNLTRRDGRFYLGLDEIEGAYYDAASKLTMAPNSELQRWLKRWK